MTHRVDITGQRFGRLTAQSAVSLRHKGKTRARWICACDCGNTTEVAKESLANGDTTSCGCFQKEAARARRLSHGRSSSRSYRVWSGLIDRCRRPSAPSFHNYGGRGIVVCDRWLSSFEAFFDDMGEPPEGLTLDRENNDGPYSKDNCRWATRKTQGRNRRGLRIVTTVDGEECLKAAAEAAGIKYGTVHSRIVKHGWSIKDALTVPAIVGQKHMPRIR